MLPRKWRCPENVFHFRESSRFLWKKNCSRIARSWVGQINFSDEVWKGGNSSARRYLDEYLEAYGIKNNKQDCWNGIEFVWKDGYYLLSVKSLNDPSSMHAIVIEIVERDEFTKAVFVYDPQRDNPNAFHYSSVAEQAWMHNNNKEKQLKLDCRSVEAYITRDSFNSGAVIQGY